MPPTPADIETLVHARIGAILAERRENVPALFGSDKLNANLGLTSLDLAFLVSDLEAELGVDPFAKLVSITSVRCIDDLVRAYRMAFIPDASPATIDHLDAAARRADLRRARRERK